MKVDVKHNQDKHCFEATIDGRLAILDYQENETSIAFTHTEVPMELRGQGIAGQLAKAALNYARERALRVVPLCSFVAVYIDRNPEYRNLL